MDRLRREKSQAGNAAARTHLVGIGGRGMSGLAQILVQRGATVTGSGRTGGPTVERLRRMGVRIHAGHAPLSSPNDADLLVYDPTIGREHPERVAATRHGIEQESATQWLSRLIRENVGVVVAGQREAGSASAMIGWILTRAGLDPTVVMGNPAPQLGGWARLGNGRQFVVEAVDEPEGFGPLGARVAVILNVAANAAGDNGERRAALRRFVSSVPADGQVLMLEPNPFVGEAVRDLDRAVEGISLERGSDWWGADLREDRGCYRFRAFHRGTFAIEVRLQVPGRRNVLSALAAVAACGRLDVPTPEIKQGLEEFMGRARDFESRGSYRGVTLVDDEGQDPSAVAETLAIVRQVHHSRRLWVIYRCEMGSVDSETVDQFVGGFALADHVVIIQGMTEGAWGPGAEYLTQALVSAGASAWCASDLDEAIRDLDRHLEPGDVLVTLGTGDVGMVADAFIRRISRDRQGR